MSSCVFRTCPKFNHSKFNFHELIIFKRDFSVTNNLRRNGSSATFKSVFPVKTRSFIRLQDQLRRRDDALGGSELVYLLPVWRVIAIKTLDTLSVVCGAVLAVVGSALWFKHYVWPTLCRWVTKVEAEDSIMVDQNQADDEWTVDEHGNRRKVTTIELNLFEHLKAKDNPIFWGVMLIQTVAGFGVVRVDKARTVLRIYWHPMTKVYTAVFPRLFFKERVQTFSPRCLKIKFHKFLITKPRNHYVLPNKCHLKYFRDAEHSWMLTKLPK